MSKNDQGELFTQNQHVLTPKKLARTEDPGTSKMAADRAIVFLGSHHRKIYDALAGMPDGTFYEIAEQADMTPSSVWRRLNELEKMGRISPTGTLRHGLQLDDSAVSGLPTTDARKFHHIGALIYYLTDKQNRLNCDVIYEQ